AGGEAPRLRHREDRRRAGDRAVRNDHADAHRARRLATVVAGRERHEARGGYVRAVETHRERALVERARRIELNGDGRRRDGGVGRGRRASEGDGPWIRQRGDLSHSGQQAGDQEGDGAADDGGHVPVSRGTALTVNPPKTRMIRRRFRGGRTSAAEACARRSRCRYLTSPSSGLDAVA